MIVFDLKCARHGHVFEAWFGSSGDYESQQQRGLVQCPLCGDPDICKAAMAPRVAAKGNASGAVDVVNSEPAQMKAMLSAMMNAQKKVLEHSDFVGDNFASEARAIHVGDAGARSIHGRATPEQTRELIDDGIKVAPLPFPVIEPGQEN